MKRAVNGCFFFFQAEDGIRDVAVTGVQTCALPISNGATYLRDAVYLAGGATPDALLSDAQVFRKTDDGKLKVISVNLAKALAGDGKDRSEERRVGEEGRSRWAPYH